MLSARTVAACAGLQSAEDVLCGTWVERNLSCAEPIMCGTCAMRNLEFAGRRDCGTARLRVCFFVMGPVTRPWDLTFALDSI